MISFTVTETDPCHYRLQYDNGSDCFTNLQLRLNTGVFASWNVNSGAGFTVTVVSQSLLIINHSGGFLPLGAQAPILFTLPYDLNTTLDLIYEDNCGLGASCIFFPPELQSCPDPRDAAISGFKYATCTATPYSNQATVPGWPIQLLNDAGEVLFEQETGVDGSYIFADLPLGQYIVREAVQPGWTPKLPASGQATIQLDASEQAVQNFGNCPAPGSVTGTVYVECGDSAYTDQPVLSEWTVSLANAGGTVLATDVTDGTGAYQFYDLPYGQYYVKVAAQTGWTPNVPATGQTSINLDAGEQEVANFSFCPGCSCDSMSITLTQLQVESDTSTLFLNIANNGAYCFPYIDVTVDTGQLVNYILEAGGWTVEQIAPNKLRFHPPGDFIPEGAFLLARLRLTGTGNLVLTTGTVYETAGNQKRCERLGTFPAHPSNFNPECCLPPFVAGPNQVVNGDFTITTCATGYTSDYTCTSPGIGSGNYNINDANGTASANGSFWRCYSKTGNPNDYFMVVDGSTTAGQAPWKTTVTVAPNTQYAFTVWASSVINPAFSSSFSGSTLQLQIVDAATNVVMSSIPYIIPSGSGWQKLCLVWTSPNAAGPVQYTIRVIETTGVGNGNDFALDCISFKSCTPPPPPCSCDSIDLTLTQIGNSMPDCCYRLDVANAVGSGNCFPLINIQVDAGLTITTPVASTGWVVMNNGPQWIQLMPVSGNVPTGTYSPLTFCVTGGSVHNIFVNTYYTINNIQKDCDKNYTFYCLASDTCFCKPSTVYISSSQGTFPVNCNTNILPIITNPTGTISFNSDFGCVDALGQICPVNPTFWTISNQQGVVQQGVFPPNTNPLSLSFPATLFLCGETYSLRMTTLCQGQTDSCVCRIFFKIECDSCCLDYQTFCDHVMNGVSVMVDNAFCKATLNIGPLPACDSLVRIDWGDGGPWQSGQWGDGAMVMHQYNQSGTYYITYTALEYNAMGQPCFDKVLQDTITVVCDTICTCSDSSWQMEIRFGGALNQPVHCGDVVTVPSNGFFVFYPKFICQGPPSCDSASVKWQFEDPQGTITSGMDIATPGFTIPVLSPANLTQTGIYTLDMWGICGTDTCHCRVQFCVAPQSPFVNDTSICKTLPSAYIPLQGCPSGCSISQVQWFVKPCSATTWPTVPYQISGAGPGLNCSDLLLLPYRYPGETCVQVYAVLTLGPGCCVTQMTSNIATIHLCDPVSCSISNNNPAFCDVTNNLQAMMVTVTGGTANCNYTQEWYDYNNLPVSTANSYTPPNFGLPTGFQGCYQDFPFTVKLNGVCGPSSCTTSIRIYNSTSNNGDLIMNPNEAIAPFPPYCPGEDFTLEYKNNCSGPPPKWTWYSSTTSGTSGFGPLTGAGMTNTLWNTNQLYQTTWYMVESQNGVCPAQQDVYQIDIKVPITIVNFTATPDPCVDSYVDLSVDFTPANASTGCQYEVQWYWNGDLIHTSVSSSSPVIYHFNNPNPGMSMAGVYYAIVKDKCCPGSANTWPVILQPTCWPVINGDCFICGSGPVKLQGEMVLPPQDPCPDISGCTFQWYEVISGVPVIIPGATGTMLFINHGGDYIFESNCNGCIRRDTKHVEQCGGTDCITGTGEILPKNLAVSIFPNPTSGDFTLKLEPAPLKNGRLEVVRLDGRVLLSEDLAAGSTEHRISLDRLTQGLYFVRLYESDFLLWTGKIVKAE